jgi:hypothetical protein
MSGWSAGATSPLDSLAPLLEERREQEDKEEVLELTTT